MLFLFDNGLTKKSSQALTESVAMVDYQAARTVPFSWLDDYTVLIPAGTRVYNAIGSADDVVEIDGTKYHTMIKLWRKLTGEPGNYCNNKYCIGDGDERIVGAHVVLEPGHTLKKGDIVYIVPLCNTCNTGIDSTDQIILGHDVKAAVLRWDGVTRK